MIQENTPWLSLEREWPGWMGEEGRSESQRWALNPDAASDQQLGLALSRGCERFFRVWQSGARELPLIAKLALALAGRGFTLAQMPWSQPSFCAFRSLGEVVEQANPKAYARLLDMGAVDFSQWPPGRDFEHVDEAGSRPAQSFGEAAAGLAWQACLGKWRPSLWTKLAKVSRSRPDWAGEIRQGAALGLARAFAFAGKAGESIDGRRLEAAMAFGKAAGLGEQSWEAARQAFEGERHFRQELAPWLATIENAIEQGALAPLRALLLACQAEAPQALARPLGGAQGDGRGLVAVAVEAARKHRSARALLALLDAGAPTLAQWPAQGADNLLSKLRKIAGDPGGQEAFERLARLAFDEMLAGGEQPAKALARVKELAAGGPMGAKAARAGEEQALLSLELAAGEWLGQGSAPSRPRPRM